MTIIKFYKTIIVLMLVLLLSLLPADTAPKIKFINIPNLDKLIHFFMYFFFSSASLIDIKNNIKYPRKLLIFLVILTIAIIGGIIEIIQANFIFGRSGSWFDLLANILGITFGIIIFYKTSIFAKFHQDS